MTTIRVAEANRFHNVKNKPVSDETSKKWDAIVHV